MIAFRKPLSRSQAARRPKRPAQAMVEFGLALPILLLVMYGLIETGRVLFIYASVVSAARQAVRYGSVTGENGSGVRFYNDCTGIRDAAKRLSFLQALQDSDIQISYDSGPGTAVLATTCPLAVAGHPINGDRIRVAVSTDFTPIVPLVPFKPFTVASSGTRTLLVGVSVAVDVPAVILTPGGSGAMSLFKSSDPASFDHVGQVINYEYTISNLGGHPIEGISMTDDKVNGQGGSVNCTGITDPLPSGDSTTCTAVYIVTAGDISAGSLTNTGSATGVSDGVPLLAQSTLTINFVPLPAITLAKSATAPTKMDPGELALYTFTITNSGNVTLNGPFSVNDPLVGVVDCPDQSDLAVGASKTCAGDYPITNQDLNNRQVVNTATATAHRGSFQLTSAPATNTLLLPELVMTMTASPASITALGQTITYTYTLQNRTSKDMSNAKVDDTRGASNWTCPAFTTVARNSSVSCNRTYSTYTQADMDGGFVTNQATAHANAVAPPRVVYTNASTVNIPVTQTKQLTLTKTADKTQALVVGETITYSYKITNTGNVTISPPFGVTDDKIPAINCTGLSSPLAPGTFASCANATYAVTADDVNLKGSVINKAKATGMFSTQTVTSAEVSTTVITYPFARLGVRKSANPAYFTAAAQTLTYTFTLLNTGGVQLNGPFTVTDTKIAGGVNCAAAVSPIPVGGSSTCTGTYVVTPAESLLERVDNSATATAFNGVTPVPSTAPSPGTLTVPKFVCTYQRVKHPPPAGIPDGTSADWTIINNSGIALQINSITISWASAPPTLTKVQLGGATLFSGNSFGNGGFFLPGGPWNLPIGNTIMHLDFSSTAASIRIVIGITAPPGAGCPNPFVVDSNSTYPS